MNQLPCYNVRENWETVLTCLHSAEPDGAVAADYYVAHHYCVGCQESILSDFGLEASHFLYDCHFLGVTGYGLLITERG